jgi:hypothetical protein
MVHHSKKDTWLVALVAGSILIPLAVGFYNLFAAGGNLSLGWILLLSAALAGAAVLLLTYPLYYEITPTVLIIRSGIPLRQIPLSEIKDVSPTRNASGAPAWSLDRLQVNYHRNGEEGFVLISPQDNLRFRRDLVSCGTGLEMRDERVIRASE